MIKNLPAIGGDMGSIPKSGRFPWRRKMATHSSILENPMDRGARWATYSPWGRKELDMTE